MVDYIKILTLWGIEIQTNALNYAEISRFSFVHINTMLRQDKKYQIKMSLTFRNFYNHFSSVHTEF